MEAIIIALFPEVIKLIIGGIRAYIKTSQVLTPEQQDLLLHELDKSDFEATHYAKKLVRNPETGRVELI